MTDATAGPGPDGPEGMPSEEEMRAAFEEQMRSIRVEDVLLQTAATLVNLGARRLGLAAAPGEDPAAERDIEQARVAIDAVRALAPLCPPEQVEPIRQALSQLQMAYAHEAQGAAPAQGAPTGPGSESPGQAAPQAPGAEAEDERAKARAKIWTPPGS